MSKTVDTGPLLKLIRKQILPLEYDKNIELWWEGICKLTYEHTGKVEERGAQFLAGDGLTLARQCYDLFPREDELILNIMIALGNMTEVEDFRPRTLAIVSMLTEVMGAEHYNFKTNYRAAAVLADLFVDDPKAWNIQISRKATLKDFRKLILSKWDVRTELITKGFEYKSLKFLMKLLDCEHTAECQLFAAFTLANLTLLQPEDYAIELKVHEREVWTLLNKLKTNKDKAIVEFATIAIEETEEFCNSVRF